MQHMKDFLVSTLQHEPMAASLVRPAAVHAPADGAGLDGSDPFDLLNDVLSQLIEDPDSAEPFRLLLEQIVVESGAAAGALFAATEAGRHHVLLACSGGTAPEAWSDSLHRLLARSDDDGGSVLVMPHPEALEASLIALRLKQGEHGHGVLLLRLLQPPDRVDANQRAGLGRHGVRLARILYSTRRARLKLRHAQSEERAAIARELHDSLAQSLSYMKIQASLLQQMVADGAPDAPARSAELDAVAQELRSTVNVAYRHLRELITTFRLTMHGRTFGQALEDSIEEFERRSSIVFELDNRMPAGSLTVAAEMQLLHIVREALANVVRHAHASSCRVTAHLTDDGGTLLCVDDDGIGIAPARDPLQHHGLMIMQERAHSLGGTLKMLASPSGGARVLVTCPASCEGRTRTGFE